MSRAVIPAATVLLLLAGCTGGGPAGTPGTVPPPPSSAGATASAASSSAPDLGAPTEIARGIAVPWGLAFLPGGDALVAERGTGRILRVPAAGGQPREVYRMPGVAPGGEGGLLGLAVAASFDTDNRVYAYFTAAHDNRIVRFTLGAQTPPEVLFTGISKASIHNGGRLAFGPDGMLYAGTGDASQRPEAQDPKDPNGKILRLAPDGKPAPGTPTAGSPVWTLGHRNVQGFAWDAHGRMFASDFGQNTFDELNLIEPGHNYGWPEVEGTGDTSAGRGTKPVVTWSTGHPSTGGIA